MLSDQKSSSTEPIPDELEDEDFLEYAEKCAALADFADLDFTTDDGDMDDLPSHVSGQACQSRNVCQISDMDVS